MESCELTILMPVLNEAETLASCIEKAKRFLDVEKIKGEILIADNGSTDGSQQIAESYGARVVSVSTRGYGSAIKHGINAANGQYIIMGDADDSYDFLNLKPFVEKLRDGFDLVMGNRFQGGIKKGAMPFLNRYLGNPVLSYFGRLFYGSHIGDFHCGLRGFKRDAFRQLDLQGNGMEFASEMVVKATLKKFTIAEVPTILSPDGRSRRPHLRPWRDGWRHLRLLLLYSPKWLFLYPGIALMLTGFLMMTCLCTGPLALGKVVFDIHTMLFASMFMIIGFQAVSFAGFAKYLSAQVKTDPIYTLEQGIIASLVLVLVGIAGACYGLYVWGNNAFGPLVPTDMMRIFIPSITACILGVQLMFSSFFISMLGIHHSR